MTYHFKVTYYVKPDEGSPVQIEAPDQSGWQVAPKSGPIEPVVVTPGAVYIPVQSPHQDFLVTMVIKGEAYQMKQVFNIEDRVYNKGGMTIEDVNTQYRLSRKKVSGYGQVIRPLLIWAIF